MIMPIAHQIHRSNNRVLYSTVLSLHWRGQLNCYHFCSFDLHHPILQIPKWLSHHWLFDNEQIHMPTDRRVVTGAMTLGPTKAWNENSLFNCTLIAMTLAPFALSKLKKARKTALKQPILPRKKPRASPLKGGRVEMNCDLKFKF